MREKLIELLKNIPQVNHNEARVHGMDYVFGCAADYFIANGVTIQKWSPASEPPKEHDEYLVMIKGANRPTTLWYHPSRKTWDAMGSFDSYTVTHWMPLPERPKGE